MGGGGSSGNVDYGPHAVEIEIYGCINIFAPPDEKKIEESAEPKTGTGTGAKPGTTGTRPGMTGTGMGTTRPGMGTSSGTGPTRPTTGTGMGR